MTPGRYDIKVTRGIFWTLRLEAKDDAGVLINFTDTYDSCLLQVRPPRTQGDPIGSVLFELTSASGQIDLSQGTQISLEIPAEDSASIAFDAGQYELMLLNGEVVDKLLRGYILVSGEFIEGEI